MEAFEADEVKALALDPDALYCYESLFEGLTVWEGQRAGFYCVGGKTPAEVQENKADWDCKVTRRVIHLKKEN